MVSKDSELVAMPSSSNRVKASIAKIFQEQYLRYWFNELLLNTMVSEPLDLQYHGRLRHPQQW